MTYIISIVIYPQFEMSISLLFYNLTYFKTDYPSSFFFLLKNCKFIITIFRYL